MKKINTKQVTLCAILTTLMFVMGIITNLISIGTGKSIFQISDVIFLALLNFLNPFTLVISAILAGIGIDLFAASAIYIPITIMVKVLITFTFIFLKRYINTYINIFLSYLWIFIYVLYVYILFDSSFAIIEATTDAIQYFANIFISIIILFTLRKINFKEKIIDKYNL
ncbi:hypothetical protein [Spiroplasma diminutum]|uniref:Transmembrane protein n=1 Tax=Spiroplasma diminutum CUAS-1 TaxID=1276221 RepID=S5LXI9_9MOLU|nr:hypothetical protein [Spiroplasma diminutum]AGR42524.1 hypothetical protein SDIMI_v3c08200 [Spiroplasma diminutum CUAS-1]